MNFDPSSVVKAYNEYTASISKNDVKLLPYPDESIIGIFRKISSDFEKVSDTEPFPLILVRSYTDNFPFIQKVLLDSCNIHAFCIESSRGCFYNYKETDIYYNENYKLTYPNKIPICNELYESMKDSKTIPTSFQVGKLTYAPDEKHPLYNNKKTIQVYFFTNKEVPNDDKAYYLIQLFQKSIPPIRQYVPTNTAESRNLSLWEKAKNKKFVDVEIKSKNLDSSIFIHSQILKNKSSYFKENLEKQRKTNNSNNNNNTNDDPIQYEVSFDEYSGKTIENYLFFLYTNRLLLPISDEHLVEGLQLGWTLGENHFAKMCASTIEERLINGTFDKELIKPLLKTGFEPELVSSILSFFEAADDIKTFNSLVTEENFLRFYGFAKKFHNQWAIKALENIRTYNPSFQKIELPNDVTPNNNNNNNIKKKNKNDCSVM